MQVSDLLKPEQVEFDLAVTDKSRLLSLLSQTAARATGLDKAKILGALQSREEFGSTGIGNGIAIPHASIPALKAPFGLFARLARPLEFNSIDQVPVDLVFLLLLPQENRSADLNALACVARQLRAKPVLASIREATRADQVFGALTAAL